MAEQTSSSPNDPCGAAAKPAPLPVSQLTLAERFLIDVARQGGIGDAAAAAVVVSVLATARDLLHSLARRITDDDFSLGRLLTVVTLKALAPMPSTAAELADHVELSRPAMTGILDGLQRRGWIARTRHAADRRIVRIRLTATGQREADRLITDFLLSATHLVGTVPPATRAGLVADCRVLTLHSRRVA